MPESLFPDKLGTELTYVSRSLDSKGMVVKEETTSRVLGVHLFGKQRWYYVYEFDYGFWMRNTDRGAEEAEVEVDEETMRLKLVSPRLFFKYPVKQGETYAIKTPDSPQQMRVAEVGAKVELPAGEFECILYELMEDDRVSSRMWIAPGVGLVKFEIPTDAAGSGAEVHELNSLA